MLKERLQSIWDVFSRRNAQVIGARYKPDEISELVRSRILLLLRDLYSGNWFDAGWESSPGDHSSEFWEEMHNSLEHLYGRPRLCAGVGGTRIEDALLFAQKCKSSEFFDFLELLFRVDATWRVVTDENNLVDAINEILKIENAPYQLTPIVKQEEERPRLGPLPSGKTIRTIAWPKVVRNDEEVTYTEAISPALSLLGSAEYRAANLEFRDALDEYRKGIYGDCLAKCGSAFESVLKVLCSRNGWAVDPKATAAPLLKEVISHTDLDGFFEQPLILIATLRNRLSSAHGGGNAPRSVERHIAQYAITSTAAAVVLLIHAVGL